MTKTLAAKFKAAVLFGEHRYYGGSFPFNDEKKAFEKENLRYIGVEQVFKDYVNLIASFKEMHDMPDAPVYVMGGSYGGMLAAWARMKYPTHFQGALAASAPILWFTNKTDPNAYTIVASQSIMDVSGKECGELQARGFFDL